MFRQLKRPNCSIRLPAWSRYSLQTRARKQSRVPSKSPKNTFTIGTIPIAAKLSPWKSPFTGAQWVLFLLRARKPIRHLLVRWFPIFDLQSLTIWIVSALWSRKTPARSAWKPYRVRGASILPRIPLYKAFGNCVMSMKSWWFPMKFNAEWDAAGKCLPIKITAFFLTLLFLQRLWGVVFRWVQLEHADLQQEFLALVITEPPTVQTRWQPLPL